MYPLASGVCNFKMNIPKMPAERDRVEVRNCKEIDKCTSANSGLAIARASRIFLKRMNDLSFCMVFVGKKGLLLSFIPQNSLEQSELC